MVWQYISYCYAGTKSLIVQQCSNLACGCVWREPCGGRQYKTSMKGSRDEHALLTSALTSAVSRLLACMQDVMIPTIQIRWTMSAPLTSFLLNCVQVSSPCLASRMLVVFFHCGFPVFLFVSPRHGVCSNDAFADVGSFVHYLDVIVKGSKKQTHMSC